MRFPISRDTATPVVIGAFLLMAVTGVLMFFESEGPLNKLAHEWLGWALVLGVAAHATVNVAGLKRHLQGTRGRVIVGVFVAVLGLSFLPVGGGAGREPPFAPAVRAIAAAPLAAVAQLGGTTEAVVRERLAAAHVTVNADATTIEAAVGKDLHDQVRAVSAALGHPVAEE